METVAETLNLTRRGFPSRSALKDYLSGQLQYPLAVVQFNDSLSGNSPMPGNLSYDLRFPSMRRQGTGNWNTDRIRRSISPSVLWGPEDPHAYSPYFTEGFLAIQHVIAMTFIRQQKRSDAYHLPDVFIQRQPFPASRMDFAVNLMGDLLSAVLIISFLPSCMNMTKVSGLMILIQLIFTHLLSSSTDVGRGKRETIEGHYEDHGPAQLAPLVIVVLQVLHTNVYCGDVHDGHL